MSEKHYPQARKRFGQNFLQDSIVIDGIIQAIHPQQGQHLVEIGPGRGALTSSLLELSGFLDVIELDRDLVPLLAKQLEGVDGFSIHQADALKFDYATLCHDDEKLRVVGNLPYNITTPLLFHLLKWTDVIEDMCFMLQKEVVERICAQPGTKQYGRLSVMLQYQCFVEQLFTVPPEAFDPVPKVESAILYMQPQANKYGQAVDESRLNKIVTQAFSQRRKTVANTLKKLISVEQLQAVNIEPTQRPETVTVEQFVELARQD